MPRLFLNSWAQAIFRLALHKHWGYRLSHCPWPHALFQVKAACLVRVGKFSVLSPCFPVLLQAQPEMGPDVLVQTMGAPALKICDKPAKVPSPPPVIAVTAVTPAPEAQDGPPSPLSEASSGYFSHSVSTATLSDALGPGLDAAAPPGSMPTAPEAEPEAPISHPPPPTAVPAEEPPGPQQLVSPGRERPDLEAPAPGSPFRVRRVRASELRSFSRMLAGDPGCSPGAEGNAPAPGAGGQALASDSEEADEVPEWLREGEFVTVGAHKTGVVRYVGPADFQEGMWVGVELDLPSGGYRALRAPGWCRGSGEAGTWPAWEGTGSGQEREGPGGSGLAEAAGAAGPAGVRLGAGLVPGDGMENS